MLIYSVDYPIVAIARIFALFRRSRRNIFLPNLSSFPVNPLFPGQPRRLSVLASRTASRCVSRKRPAFCPVSARFHPSPPGAAVASPSSGTCCCLSGAAVALPLPRLAAIRVPFSSGVAALPVPSFLGRLSHRFAASTSRSLLDAGCLYDPDNLLFGGFLCTFAPQTESS